MERKETGELVETVEVQRAIENLIANAKSKLLSLGHRLGPRVAIETDAAKCKDIIDGGVREALAELVAYRVEDLAG